MKRIVLFTVVLAMAASCSIKEMEMANVPAPSMYGYTEEDQATKTAITVDGEGVGTIWWKPADNINVFFGTTSVRYYSTNEVDATTVVFETSTMLGSTESASDNKWGLYPYNSAATCDGASVTTTIPAAQQCVPETFGNNLFPMIAHTATNELHFKNVCGGIKFSLSRDDIQSITFKGNNNEDIVGKVRLTHDGDENPVANVVAGEKTITLTPNTGSTFVSGTNYYLVMLPTVLSQGFTMTFETETELGTFEYTAKSIEIKRSVFAKKADIDTYAEFNEKPSPAKDLSEGGTANCYIVSEYGPCKFNATTKGHTNESVGTIASAEVLWESFGTSSTPAVGDIVSNVSVENGIVAFTASGKDGNAVIAVKDASGDILWSWHIWICQDFDPEATAQAYRNNAGIVMDRNLGATSVAKGNVKALGLLYQWGRKDPFLGSSSISSNTKAKSTISWPAPVSSDSSNGTIDYVVKHPTTFVIANKKNYDWYFSGDSNTDNTRWKKSEKTMYDPCPRGWRVPDGGSGGLWSKAFGTSSYWQTSSNWLSTYKGMDFGATEKKLGSGTIWYPASGSLSDSAGTLVTVGEIGRYWSCVPTSNKACELYFYFDGAVSPSSSDIRARGHSVRCVKQ